MPSFDLRNEIHELTDTELRHLINLTQDTVFIKFLRNKALQIALEIALEEPDSSISDLAFRIKNAHNSAYLRAYNDLLSDIQKVIPNKE